nr:hypothetical protein [Tanacetum cinerariifolium]
GRIKAIDSDCHLRSCPSGLGGVDGCKGTKRYDILVGTRKETNWKGSSTKEGNSYKMWYSGSCSTRSREGVILAARLKDNVVQVTTSDDRIMALSVVIEGETVNVISAYGDLNNHVGTAADGYVSVQEGFGFRARNDEGHAVLEFDTAHDLDATGRSRILWKKINEDVEETFKATVFKKLLALEEDMKRLGEYFSSLFNELPSNKSRPEGSRKVGSSSLHLLHHRYYSRIKQGEVRIALQKMWRNKAIGSDQIPIEAWRCLEDEGVKWLTFLFNKIFSSAKMPDEWRLSRVIPIYKNTGDMQAYGHSLLN